MCPFVAGLFPLASCLQGSSVLEHGTGVRTSFFVQAEYDSILRLYCILFIYRVTGFPVTSTGWLLSVKLLPTFLLSQPIIAAASTPGLW